MLLKRVTGFENSPQFRVVREVVTTSNIELICDSPSMAVTHIQRICNGIDADIALIFIAEVGFNAIDKMIPDDVPKDGFEFVFFLFDHRCSTFTSSHFVILIINGLFFMVESIWTNLLHQCNVVGIYDGIG